MNEQEIFENQENAALILDTESALHISIVVQNRAIGVKWKDDRFLGEPEERLFNEPKLVELLIAELLEKHLDDEMV